MVSCSNVPRCVVLVVAHLLTGNRRYANAVATAELTDVRRHPTRWPRPLELSERRA